MCSLSPVPCSTHRGDTLGSPFPPLGKGKDKTAVCMGRDVFCCVGVFVCVCVRQPACMCKSVYAWALLHLKPLFDVHNQLVYVCCAGPCGDVATCRDCSATVLLVG